MKELVFMYESEIIHAKEQDKVDVNEKFDYMEIIHLGKNVIIYEVTDLPSWIANHFIN